MKRTHELPDSDSRDWIVSYRFAKIVLRDVGRFLLGMEQPQEDYDFDDDPFTDLGRQEVERKVAKEQNPQGEVGYDDDKDMGPVMRLAAASGWIESTNQFERSLRNGKLQRVFKSIISQD